MIGKHHMQVEGFVGLQAKFHLLQPDAFNIHGTQENTSLEIVLAHPKPWVILRSMLLCLCPTQTPAFVFLNCCPANPDQ